MIPNQDGWTIVIPGYWNRMIFMPPWVTRVLFERDEVERLVPVMPLAPLLYQDEGIRLHVDNRRVSLNARHPSRECLERMESIALRLLRELQRTPISAVGVNFAFREERPGDSLLDTFNFSDDGNIAELNWTIRQRQIVRRLSSDDLTMNLTLALSNGVVSIDANFHSDVQDATGAIQALEGQICARFDNLQTLLAAMHDLRYNIAGGQVSA